MSELDLAALVSPPPPNDGRAMSRRRLLIIVTPALVVGAVEAVSDTLLDPVLPFPVDALVVTVLVLVLSVALSGVAFRRIDALGTTLAARNRELETRAASAAALHRVSVAIAALVDLREILDAVVDNARTLLAADVAVLLLADQDGEMQLATSSGSKGALDPTGGLASSESADDVARFIHPQFVIGRLVTQLQRGTETIGLLAIGSRRTRSFDSDAIETLASLANQASIAIENARLQARLRDLAVETERERIAREMHDGLAQVLGYVGTKSQAVEELLASDRVSDARGQLEELAAAARSMYVDVREAILGLRSPIGPELGLAGAIEQYARRFAEASKLVVTVVVSPRARAVTLAPEAEAQIFRIVQESLTNVRKHAGAGRVDVRLDRHGNNLTVELVDDGRGFGTSITGAADWPHYGLAAMSERAASIGARVTWTNGAAGGGIVRLDLPLETTPVGVVS